MKRLLCVLAFAAAAAGAHAQNPYIAPVGASENASGVTVSQPRSLLAVDLRVACERIVAGPYARYAQKFLGVRAPLTDKTVWTIEDASVKLIDAAAAFGAAAPAEASAAVVSHAEADGDFPHFPVDKTSSDVPALEDAARNAANTIFSLRRHRMELITGEAGENVFGEGLQAALNEIARQEQGYLELFLGKRVVTEKSSRCIVAPQADKKQYVVCRFTTSEGLLSANDLSGDMVVLQIEPSGDTAVDCEAGAKETNVASFRVADPAVCTVECGGRQYVRTVLPLFEFGRTVRVALPRRK